MEEIGQLCSKEGIYVENLMDYLKCMDKSKLTNGMALEIYKYANTPNLSITFAMVCEAIRALHQMETLKPLSLRSSINTIKSVHKKLQKNTKTKEQKERPALFLDEQFKPPRPVLKRPYTQTKTKEEVSLPKVAKVDCDGHERKVLKENERLRKANDQLEKENMKLRRRLQSSNANLKRVYSLVGNYSKPKYFIQAAKRKKLAIDRLKKKERTERMHRMKIEKEHHKAIRKENERANVDPKLTQDELKRTVDLLKEERQVSKCLENRVAQLEEEIEERKLIPAKENGKINPKIKEASMYLQSLGIAEHKCSEAIKLIVETVTSHTIQGNLPSRSSQGRVASEMKALAMKRVVDGIKDKEASTVGYDGTTGKLGRHVTEIELATDEETFLIGLRLQPSSTAKDYAQTIIESLDDVDRISGNDNRLLSKVKNTITDRCVTNTAVTKELEQAKGENINEFFCGMHPLHSFQMACNNVLRDTEQNPANTYPHMLYRHRGESLTQALLRCIDKLFYDNSVGMGHELSNYLRSQGFHSDSAKGEKRTMYQRWVGNKFNILFKNASYALVYSQHIVTYLTKVNRSKNQGALAVLSVLHGLDCHTQLQCLTIVEKFISGPWQALVSQTDTILALNENYNKAQQMITAWAEDPLPLFDGTQTNDCFGSPVKPDIYLQAAQNIDNNNMEEACSIMKALLNAILTIVDRQLQDQLPGGKFWSPSDQLIEESRSCPADNISGERKFARMKAQQLKAPAMTMTKIEQREMFNVNKVKESLLAKSKEQREKDVIWATAEGAKIRANDKRRSQKYKERMRARLEQSRRDVCEKEQRSRESMESMLETVSKYGGFWSSASDIENNTKHLNDKAKKEAIKAQIKTRITILQCKPEGKLLLSKASSREMATHLTNMIKNEIPTETSFLHDVLVRPSMLVNSHIIHKFEDQDSGMEQSWKGTIRKIVVNQHGQQEFEFVYDDEPTKPCYETIEELVVDLASGDLVMME